MLEGLEVLSLNCTVFWMSLWQYLIMFWSFGGQSFFGKMIRVKILFIMLSSEMFLQLFQSFCFFLFLQRVMILAFFMFCRTVFFCQYWQRILCSGSSRVVVQCLIQMGRNFFVVRGFVGSYFVNGFIQFFYSWFGVKFFYGWQVLDGIEGCR